MPFVNGVVPNMIGGISQQPARVRDVSQFANQVNWLSDAVRGLETRPPSEYISNLGVDIDDDAFTHVIDRGDGNQHMLIVNDSTWRVVDLADGSLESLSALASTDYLYAGTGSPRAKLRALTIADTTFILNTEETVAKAATKSASRNPEALVNIRAGEYGTTYEVELAGTTVSYRTDKNNPESLDTTWIAKVLTGEENAAYSDDLASTDRLQTSDFAGYTFTRIGSVIHITQASDFEIRAGDGVGGTVMTVAKDELQDFTDLPAKAYDGFKIKITGTPTSAFDDYWVVFRETAGDGEGIWEETVEPNIDVAWDNTSLPHTITPNAAATTWTWNTQTWTQRLKGDDTSNPFPSLLGKEIADLFFSKDRLCFLADEAIVCSESGSFYNFFRTTTTDLLDSDPIDVTNSSNKVAVLRHAIPIAGKVLVTSEDQQFFFGAQEDQLLTPKTAAIDPVGNFEIDQRVQPVAVGPYAYFVNNGTQYGKVWEMYFDQRRETQDALDITSIVPRLLNKDVFEITGSADHKLFAFLSDNTGNRASLYVWKYFEDGEKRVQSAWSTWNFGQNTLVTAKIVENYIYVLRRVDSSNCYLERINIESGNTLSGASYRVNLDRLADQDDCTVTVSGGDTTITMPYTITNERVKVIIKAGQTLDEGRCVYDASVTGNQIVVVGIDLSAEDFWIGTEYTCTLQFSEFFARDQNGLVVPNQRLKLRTLSVQFEDTHYFDVNVGFGTVTYVYEFSGHVISTNQTLIGNIIQRDGEFIAPIGGASDEAVVTITTDSYLPARLVSAGWSGTVTRKR